MDPSSPSCSPPDEFSTPSNPYIKLLVYPSPILVAFSTAATILPTLLAQYSNPDYIFHIGMAGGRDHYALEMRARREGYLVRDVQEKDGKRDGEDRWKAMGLPAELRVGWDGADVLRRWRDGVKGTVGAGGPGKGELCRLSEDAGRFFCEFSLYESLGWRLLEEAKQKEIEEKAIKDAEGEETRKEAEKRKWTSKKGKVAFLHVPGATDKEGVERGVRVAEAAIRALVGSWEARRRAEGWLA